MTTSSRPGASTEGAPLLATRFRDETGDVPRRLTARFTPLHAVACAVAALGFLCVFAGDRLGGVAGARSSTQRLSRTSRLNAPALSSEFVDRLNARPGRSWSARVPKGMESATHADLARLSGGRLSAAPKDTSVWRASAFASTTRPSASSTSDAAVDANARPRSESALGAVTRTFGLSGRLGGFIEDFLGSRASASRGAPFRPARHGLPDAFDAREKWPRCAALIGRGRDQGNCGSCWAMAPAEVMSDRLCIQTNGAIARELSPFQLLACARGYGAAGCDGGESSAAYEYAMKTGVVTGGAFGDIETCAPYPFEACNHPCSVFPTPECPATCTRSSSNPPAAAKSGDDIAAAALGGDAGDAEDAMSSASFGDMNTKVKARAITSCPTFDYACIARELYTNGPVSTYAGDIYEEFYAYSDGVFRESEDPELRGDNHGGHVMKIIGWGKDEASGEYYWTVVNSWLNWGQDGVGKIALGQVGIGAGVEAAVMEVPASLESPERRATDSR